jgi:two-component system cell cycle sensor histidine kinase/response regulator CckA
MKAVLEEVAAAEAKRLSKKSITTLLLVEDNPAAARLLREMFNEEGSYHTELKHVETMDEAEKYLADHVVDVALLDLGLPDAHGLEAVRRAHAIAPCVPLVVLTSLDDESLALQALKEGAQDYLVKGQVEARALVRALRYAIERKTGEEELFAERRRSGEAWARLAAIHEATPDLVTISDPEGRLLYVNPGGRKMIGLDDEGDITGRTIADFLPNAAAARIIPTEGLQTAVRDGIWRGEAELVNLAGRTISISQIILAHKRADGSLEFVSSIARDITERKRTEQRLAAQLALTKLLNEEAPLAETTRGIMRIVCENLGWEMGALWEVDPEGQRMHCVDAWHDSTVSTDVAAELTKDITFLRGEGLPGAVWESGRAMWVTDLEDVKRFPRGERAVHAGIRAAFAFPILHQGNVLGVMEFFSRAQHDPDQALLPAMTLIGSQIGESIDRRRTAQALRDSEERYRVVSETAPDAIFTIDSESRILFCNPAVERVFGYAPSEMIGKKLETIIPERFREAHRRGIARFLSTHTRHIPWNGVELIGQHHDGHEFPIEISFGEWTSGPRTIFTGYARDITKRKRTDEALRASEARLRLLLDSNIVGVAFWKTSGEILNANDLFLEMIGYSRDDLQRGLSWIELTPPEYAPADAKALAEMAATGTCTAFEKEYIRKNGSRVTALVGSALLEGQSDAGTSFVMDITERKQAEARLSLQSAALNAAANAMIIAEHDGTIVWINPAFTELTGYTDEEAIGRNVRDLLDSGAHDEAFYRDIEDTILAGESWSGEITNRRKDGRLYPEATIITPVKDETGAVSHFISIKTDLTAQRQMEAQLRQSQKMEAVGQLAAGVAHEFNNLLQALMSKAAIVRLRSGTAEGEKIGAEMEVQIKRGASITQQLLLFSRSHATEKSNLDLREKVRKASLLLRQLLPENIRIVVETSPERLSFEGDKGQMQQVLLNLAINARDAMPAGGTLTLRSGSYGGEVFLEVEDTGHGMDEATRARIFEPFFTTKEVGKGSGLGLAVVHGIVQQHGGRIEVHSRPGEGSRFRIILPAALSKVLTPEPDNDAEVPMAHGRVLLVEDEEGVRAGIEVLLEMIGYEVTAVGSGEEAMAIPLEPAPDLLLSDVTLPGIAGLALGELLRERWPSLKVVLMSGYIEEALRSNASERGWHFLQKPFEMADLASHLRAALGGEMPGTMTSQARSRSAAADVASLLPQTPLGPVSDLATTRPLVA